MNIECLDKQTFGGQAKDKVVTGKEAAVIHFGQEKAAQYLRVAQSSRFCQILTNLKCGLALSHSVMV